MKPFKVPKGIKRRLKIGPNFVYNQEKNILEGVFAYVHRNKLHILNIETHGGSVFETNRTIVTCEPSDSDLP
jgi:hypothetical protein